MDPRVMWAVELLRAQRMPRNEIGAVLEADDPEEIRRRLELHGERLQERLADQLEELLRAERLLTEALGRVPETEQVVLSPAGTR
jgi:hypothetical protein